MKLKKEEPAKKLWRKENYEHEEYLRKAIPPQSVVDPFFVVLGEEKIVG